MDCGTLFGTVPVAVLPPKGVIYTALSLRWLRQLYWTYDGMVVSYQIKMLRTSEIRKNLTNNVVVSAIYIIAASI